MTFTLTHHKKQPDVFCLQCHHIGQTKEVVPGSFIVELFAWCMFALPGLIYTIWRKASAHKACVMCGAKNLVPIDSPIAKKMLAA